MKRLFALPLAILACAAFAQSSDPSTGAHLASQAAADAIRKEAGSDGAFIAAGYINPNYDSNNLATLVQYPAEKIVVLNLTGSDIKAALQRSASLYPEPNMSFLQISGFNVEFRGSGPAAARILNVAVNGLPLEMSKTYTVAMPAGLAGGALGYFKIWDKSKIAKTLDSTMEHALSGKPYLPTAPRWVLR